MSDLPVDAMTSLAASSSPSLVPHLGRFQRGARVAIGVTLGGLPDACPVAVVRDQQGAEVERLDLGMHDRRAGRFGRVLSVDHRYEVGNYSVDFVATVGGANAGHTAHFEVIAGGDSGGAVVSLASIERPEATYVLAQLDTGRIVQGRNPSL